MDFILGIEIEDFTFIENYSTIDDGRSGYRDKVARLDDGWVGHGDIFSNRGMD